MRLEAFAILLISLATACAAPEGPVVNTPTPLPVQTVVNTPTPVPVQTVVNTPTPLLVQDADAAIAAVKAQFPEVAKIQKKRADIIIGATTDITTFQRADGWDLVFLEGSGDCEAGCINNRYSYFSAKKDGSITKVGEYVRAFNEDKNSFETTGAPMWGVPK